MKRSDILDTAKRLVCTDRNATHGEPESNLGTIAAYWSAHLDRPISAADVAVMMNLAKCARIKTSPAHPDHWIDGAGYMALGGELSHSAAQRAQGGADRHRPAPPSPMQPVDVLAVTGTLTSAQRRDLLSHAKRSSKETWRDILQGRHKGGNARV